MTTPNASYHTHQLHLGAAHASPACVPERLLADVDPLLQSRKGLLYLAADESVTREQLDVVVGVYYSDPSFDTVPALARALAAAYASDPTLERILPLAVVALGSELHGVGNEHAGLWLAHRDEARSLLAPWTDASGQAWRVGRWRLQTDDVVILGGQGLDTKLSRNKIRQLALARRPLSDSARALARASATERGKHPPTILLRVPGFSPVAGIGGQSQTTSTAGSSTATPELRNSRQRSPIWTALLVAAVLVGASLLITKPDLSRESLIASLAWALTPMPTETPAPTPTPTQPAELPPSYRTAEAQATQLAVERAAPLGTRDARATPAPTSQPASAGAAQVAQPTITPTPTRGEILAPVLVYPEHDQRVDPTYLTLEWEWDGELGEDEYFDVRLWLLGAEEQGIAWTKDHQYIKRAVDAGWHSWTVVVIRGRDGVMQEELSPQPAPANFYWSVRGKTDKSFATSEPEPTAVPAPTRNDPGVQPTRVSQSEE